MVRYKVPEETRKDSCPDRTSEDLDAFRFCTSVVENTAQIKTRKDSCTGKDRQNNTSCLENTQATNATPRGMLRKICNAGRP